MNKVSKGSSLQTGIGFLSLSIVAIGFIASTALVGRPVQAPRAAEPIILPTPTPMPLPSSSPVGGGIGNPRPTIRPTIKPISR